MSRPTVTFSSLRVWKNQWVLNPVLAKLKEEMIFSYATGCCCKFCNDCPTSDNFCAEEFWTIWSVGIPFGTLAGYSPTQNGAPMTAASSRGVHVKYHWSLDTLMRLLISFSTSASSMRSSLWASNTNLAEGPCPCSAAKLHFSLWQMMTLTSSRVLVVEEILEVTHLQAELVTKEVIQKYVHAE